MKQSLSRRSKSIHSTHPTHRQAIDKASQLISTLIEQLSQQKRKYQSLESLYFTLLSQHEQLQSSTNSKDEEISSHKQHIKIEENKIKELHLEIARLLKVNRTLKEGVSKNRIRNMNLEEENRHLMKKSVMVEDNRINRTEMLYKGVLETDNNQNLMKRTEFTQSTDMGLGRLKTCQFDELALPSKVVCERLGNTDTKPNRRKHQSEIIQYGQRKGNARRLPF